MGYTKIDTAEIAPKEIEEFERYLGNNGMKLERTPWMITVRKVNTLERVAHSQLWKEVQDATGFSNYMRKGKGEMVD